MKYLSLCLVCISVSFLFVGCNNEEMGCTDPTADNYNPDATQDDGNCVISGCTDSTAPNYDSNANRDDGSCATWLELHLGDYTGPIICGGLLDEVNNNNQNYTIVADPSVISGANVEFNLLGIEIVAKGIVDETTLTINHIQEDITYDPGIGPIVVDMLFDGNLEFVDNDYMTSSGVINVVVSDAASGQLIVDDFCDMMLNKN